jgi:hypothetical protein
MSERTFKILISVFAAFTFAVLLMLLYSTVRDAGNLGGVTESAAPGHTGLTLTVPLKGD